MDKKGNGESYDRKSAFSYFRAFLQYKIDHEGAKQVDIAKAVEVRPEYVNRVYNERQGCSVHVQEKIARFFGTTYLEALAIGRNIKEKGTVPARPDTPPDETNSSNQGRFNRRAADKILETDIVSYVSQWASRYKETRENLTKFQNIIENLSEGIVILDRDLTIEYQNRSHREMFGGSLVGQFCNVAHDCERHICECPSIASKKTGMPAKVIFPYAKGTVSAMTTPIRNLSGDITGYVTVLHDITERQKLMTMAEKALEMYDRAVLVYDDKLHIKFYNSELKAITGADDSDLSSFEKFLKYLEKNNILKNYDKTVELLRDARVKKVEAHVEIHLNNGKKWKKFLYHAKPMFTNEEKYIGRMGVFTQLD